MEYEELTHRIIGCAYTVYNKLGFGFMESVYRKAMVIELTRADIKVEAEKPLSVYYDEYEVGEFYLDLFVEDTVILMWRRKRLEHDAKVEKMSQIDGCVVWPKKVFIKCVKCGMEQVVHLEKRRERLSFGRHLIIKDWHYHHNKTLICDHCFNHG